MLTNGGGTPEPERATYLNEILKGKVPITTNELILCHSPFSDSSMVDKYQDSFVIVSGLGKMIDISNLYGYKKAIDLFELYAIYPEICPPLKDQLLTESEIELYKK